MLLGMHSPPPRNGLFASRIQLPAGPWGTVLDALAAQFPSVTPADWHSRFERELVLDQAGQPLRANHPYQVGQLIHYYREVPNEVPVPFQAKVLYADTHLVVADKPHFLPVTPAGSYVQETLLTRLTQQLDNPELVPLHRLDRSTAGLVMFSAQASSRAHYQALFRERRIEKHYEALAAPLPQQTFPLVHRSRLQTGEPFFRMQEVIGPANSETVVTVLQQGSACWRYGLQAVTGKKHQLRVHMAALGAAILHDDFYPVLSRRDADDFSLPLQLLARSLRFTDPLTGQTRYFESEQRLPDCIGSSMAAASKDAVRTMTLSPSAMDC